MTSMASMLPMSEGNFSYHMFSRRVSFGVPGAGICVPTGGKMFDSWGHIKQKWCGIKYPGVAVETLKPRKREQEHNNTQRISQSMQRPPQLRDFYGLV